MKGARKFAELRDERGKPVVQFFGPPRSNDALSICLRIVTHQLRLSQPDKEHSGGGGMFGGEFGYGVKFENDVFMMHPYCWCEKDDCLWCGGSCGCGEPYELGYFLDGKRITKAEHDAWNATIQKPLPWEATKAKHGSREYKAHQKAFDDYIAERDQRSGHIWPAVVHTCQHAMFYSRTEEIWAKYCPEPHPHSAPHFWHKPSGLRVWWYKYIGRDMIVSSPSGEWNDLHRIFDSTLTSFGSPTIADSVEAYEKAEEEAAEGERRSFEFFMSPEGQALTASLFKTCEIKAEDLRSPENFAKRMKPDSTH